MSTMFICTSTAPTAHNDLTGKLVKGRFTHDNRHFVLEENLSPFVCGEYIPLDGYVWKWEVHTSSEVNLYRITYTREGQYGSIAHVSARSVFDAVFRAVDHIPKDSLVTNVELIKENI